MTVVHPSPGTILCTSNRGLTLVVSWVLMYRLSCTTPVLGTAESLEISRPHCGVDKDGCRFRVILIYVPYSLRSTCAIPIRPRPTRQLMALRCNVLSFRSSFLAPEESSVEEHLRHAAKETTVKDMAQCSGDSS
ncbi:hypothetical protein BDZ45DRAFT_240167 [Acephala macrosclerotiorum]|nr:hypothetical protein BDZ45DRAFT_240167 [Acephala macrosclerotiorum]